MTKETYMNLFMEQLERAYMELSYLSYLWSFDDEHGIDLNDFASEDYPFDKSLDDLVLDVSLWVFNTKERIKNKED